MIISFIEIGNAVILINIPVRILMRHLSEGLYRNIKTWN